MDSDLKSSQIYVGIKQSTEAVISGMAKKAIVADDTDDHVKLPFLKLCAEKNIPVEFCESKNELGKECGIDVGAACAVLLK